MNALLYRGVTIAAVTCVVAGFSPRSAAAAPIADVQYVATDLGGGLFEYDYTLSNLSDPVADAGFDAYDLFLTFSPAASIVDSSVPDGWDVIPGAGFVDAFSLTPGASPLGTDVGPGQSLSGFDFTFDSSVGALPFQVTIANPVDPFNPVVVEGTAEAQSTPVPEPSSCSCSWPGLRAIAAGSLHQPFVAGSARGRPRSHPQARIR